MNYLDKIVENKRAEVEAQKKLVPQSELESRLKDAPPAIAFAQSIRTRNGIIAEFKRRSPSKGEIHVGEITPKMVVPLYEKAGVSAVSVLGDATFFGGRDEDIVEAVGCLNIPVLRKEFIIDEYQVYQARALGASAILLIAACLDRATSARLASLAKSLGMEVLMELHGEDEFGYISDGVTVAGINNRNLKTFEVDLNHSVTMAKMLPRELPKISESGIGSVGDMLRLRRGGFDGFLIGENFMKAENPGEACIDFCRKYVESL